MASEIENPTPTKVIKESIRIMTPFAKCKEYLVHMPRFVAKMGELINSSSQNDFPINTAKVVYQHIKHPESFRACLMQVCNSSWWAFNEAHNSMTEIYIHTSAAPEYFYNIEMILKEGNDDQIQTQLPVELNNIKEVVDNCMKLSVAIKAKFEEVLCFIQELVEVLLTLQCVCGEELIKIKDRLEVTEAKLQEQKNLIKKDLKKKELEAMGKELEDAQKRYKENADAAEWKLTAMKIFGALSSPGLMAIFTESIQQVKQRSAEDIKQRKEELEKKRQQFNNRQKKIMKTKKEHAKNVETSRKYEHQDNNLKATIRLLVEGFEAMTHLQKQWQNMVHFFQMLSNFVKANITRPAKNAEGVCGEKILISHQTIQASYVTYLVHMISEIYTRTSNQHLMETVGILFNLMTLDKGTPEFQSTLDQLQKQCKDVETAINPSLKIDLDDSADEKQLAILPAATPEENSPIKESHPN